MMLPDLLKRAEDNTTRREILKMCCGLLASIPFCFFITPGCNASQKVPTVFKEGGMNLPKPRTDGNVSVEKAIKTRRTVRAFSSRQLTLEQFSQLLWSGQGITQEGGYKRAAPSAGALYPMDVYAVAGNDGVEDIVPGIYHYETKTHSLSHIAEGDHRDELARASLSQTWVAKAPVSLVICAEYRRITGKYGMRGERYAIMESGHIAQNIFLQARALSLDAGIVGAFVDAEVKKALRIEAAHEPLLIMPVGYR
jgi:SagB-type dehydrogenase family enzyme